jgi:hypothetical protein
LNTSQHNFIEHLLDVVDIAEGSSVCTWYNGDKYECAPTCNRGRQVRRIADGMTFYMVFNHGQFLLIENSD